MNGVCRNVWVERFQGPLAGALVLAALAGCGGEQRSGAVPTDSARSAVPDTSTGSAVDTSAARRPDTSVAAVRESTAARADTAKAVATGPAPTKPASRPVTPKPSRPKPATPKPSPPKPDTTGAARAQDTAPDTNSTPAETTATSTATSQANAPLRDPYHRAPLDTVPQQVYDGWKQFNLNCARCHGEDAQGTTIAPHLIVSLKPDGPINTKELFVQTVCAGRPEKGMPSWCALGMEMPTIEAIYSYVKGRSDAKIHPGRPAVRSGG